MAVGCQLIGAPITVPAARRGRKIDWQRITTMLLGAAAAATTTTTISLGGTMAGLGAATAKIIMPGGTRHLSLQII